MNNPEVHDTENFDNCHLYLPTRNELFLDFVASCSKCGELFALRARKDGYDTYLYWEEI